MPNPTLKNAVLLAAALLLAACSEAPKGDQATITEEKQAADASGQTYTVDTSDSYIRFTGHGVGKNHPGKFKLVSGTVAVSNNHITGGQFVIDIKSMDLEQKEGIFQQKLRPHLMSGDFFDADKFGTAKFELTNVEPYKPTSKDTSIIEGANFSVSGNLTLKDVTKNITFPAHIQMEGSALHAKANFDIDRTQWQLNYGNDKTLGDNFISETVNIELDLKANRP